jgi:hypothetical protein
MLAWLQGKYVRYIATAHSDALNRARQLQYEVRGWSRRGGVPRTIPAPRL